MKNLRIHGFKNIFKFSKNDSNKFIVLLRKDVYPYEFMDDQENFNKTSLLVKEEFYSKLNMENIKDSNYNRAKIICNDFEMNNLGEYQDLFLERDTLLLADVLENFRKICLEIYQLNPGKFRSSPQ